MAGFNAFYFSFITLSTVGYGDITPVSRIARWLAAMEAMTGLLYVTVLIARLVALYRSGEGKFHIGNSTPKSDDSCSDVYGCREADAEIDEVHAAFLENDDKISVIPKNK